MILKRNGYHYNKLRTQTKYTNQREANIYKGGIVL